MSETIKTTTYTIHQEDERLTVLEDGKPFTKGFMTEADALHSIWQENNAVPHHFYVVDDKGEVACVDRGAL